MGEVQEGSGLIVDLEYSGGADVRATIKGDIESIVEEELKKHSDLSSTDYQVDVDQNVPVAEPVLVAVTIHIVSHAMYDLVLKPALLRIARLYHERQHKLRKAQQANGNRANR